MICFSTSQRHAVTLCNVNYSPEGYYHPDRTMQEYDFLYMIAGSWDICERDPRQNLDVPYHLEPGKLLILEPGRHHYSTGKSTPNMRNMFLHCSPLPGDHTFTDTKTTLSDSDVPESALIIPKLTDCSTNHQITNLYEQIIESFWSKNPYRKLRTSSLFDLLLTELALSGNPACNLDDYLTREIIQRFHSEPERFFSPEELALDYNCSIRTLSSRFKKATGQSLHQYQLTLKLHMAHEQIPLSPGRGLRDIALSFGFYDEYQFSKLYKRQFGYPPSRRRSGLS